MIVRILAAALALTAGLAATPAAAQPKERYIQLFGTDRCPASTSDEVVVCGRAPERERFRIPENLREVGTADAVTQESRVDEMVAVGRTGTDSCSAVGPGGFTGCFQRQVEANRAERRNVNRSKSEEPR